MIDCTIVWQDIDTCPKVRGTHWFKWADGTIKIGRYEPYWCSSDCPCYDLDEGPDELMNCYPDCWGVEGHETDPTHWGVVE